MEIDTEWTENIICPYCWYEDINSWEYDLSEKYSNIECWNCEKEFLASIELKITYFSKIKEK